MNLEALFAGGPEPVDDFENGFELVITRPATIKTYKFQSPRDRKKSKKLAIIVNPRGKKLNVRLRTDSGFLSRPNNIGSFSAGKQLRGKVHRQ